LSFSAAGGGGAGTVVSMLTWGPRSRAPLAPSVGQSAQSMTLPQVTSPMAIALPLGEKEIEDG